MPTRLEQALQKQGLSTQDLADRMGVYYEKARRWVKGDVRIGFEEAIAIAKAIECDPIEIAPDEFRKPPKPRTVPLVGYVGAGAMYYPDPVSGAWVGFDEVEAPPDSEDVVAVKARGESMEPVYRDGYLLYFRRDGRHPDELVGEDCIIQVRGGPAYVKTLRRGSEPGRFTLEAYGGPAIENVEVEWASPILWVKRSKSA
jgi:repressor LexA